MAELNDQTHQTLLEYAASDARGAIAMQTLSGVRQLEHRGYVEWAGRWLGTNMYRITPAGRAALGDGDG